MNKTVIAEVLRKNPWLQVVDPNRVLREVPVKAAIKVRTVLDSLTRAGRFSDALTCPKCASADVRHSRSRSVWEASRRQLTVTCPYRCGKCGYRGWGPDNNRHGRRLSSPVDAAARPSDQPYVTGFAATPARWEQLDFHALNIPRR